MVGLLDRMATLLFPRDLVPILLQYLSCGGGGGGGGGRNIGYAVFIWLVCLGEFSSADMWWVVASVFFDGLPFEGRPAGLAPWLRVATWLAQRSHPPLIGKEVKF